MRLAPVSVVTVEPGALWTQGHLCILFIPGEAFPAGTVCLALPCLALVVPAVKRAAVRSLGAWRGPLAPSRCLPGVEGGTVTWGLAAGCLAASPLLLRALPQGPCLLWSTLSRVANLGTLQGRLAILGWVLPNLGMLGRCRLSKGLGKDQQWSGQHGGAGRTERGETRGHSPERTLCKQNSWSPKKCCSPHLGL